MDQFPWDDSEDEMSMPDDSYEALLKERDSWRRQAQAKAEAECAGRLTVSVEMAESSLEDARECPNDETKNATAWAKMAEKAEAERDEFKRLGQQFERDARAHFDQSCTNLSRAEKAEAAVAAMREALKLSLKIHIADDHTERCVELQPVRDALASEAGRGWVSPEVARAAIGALEQVRAELELATQDICVRSSRESNASSLALLKKAVGE